MPAIMRGVAILIALLAVLDPALSLSRPSRPLLSVISTHEDDALAQRLVRALRRDFVVVEEPFGAADAGVIVGSSTPAADLPNRLFAVVPEDHDALTLESVDFPRTVQRESLARVRSVMRLGGRPSRVVATLRSGDLLLDRITLEKGDGDAVLDTALSFVPSLVGSMQLSLTLTRNGDSARIDGITAVRDEPWHVLFYDPRPSWMSTFVRRAAEEDARFLVASRIATSRGIATSAGAPPSSLADLAQLVAYDAVVVGAVDAMTRADARGLEAYLRRRGGSVVLLMDDDRRGPVDSLLRVGNWRTLRTPGPAVVSGSSKSALRASAMMWPAELPLGAEAVAVTDSVGGPAGRPVIWQAAVGAGRVIVSGAIDAWHFRDPTQSDFAPFWTNVLAEAAAASPAPITLRLDRAVLPPGDSTSVLVTIRDLVLDPPPPGSAARTDAMAVLTNGSDTIPVALWPEPGIGLLHATLRAPATPGVWSMEVETDHGKVTTSLLVADGSSVGNASGPRLLEAVVSSRGGVTVEAARVAELGGAMLASMALPVRLERWYPMRSAWWIIPFALALGYEWWMRRRRGLA
jgi:hypothetical protein